MTASTSAAADTVTDMAAGIAYKTAADIHRAPVADTAAPAGIAADSIETAAAASATVDYSSLTSSRIA